VDKYFPSPTPTLTRTPTSTPTPNLTATQQVVQATGTAQSIQTTVAQAGSQWSILLADTFDTNKNEWYEGTDDDEYGKVIYEIVNGNYRWDAIANKGFIGWVNIDTEALKDFFIAVDIEQTESSPLAQQGLLFRKDAEGNYYCFGVEDGQFFVSLRYNGEWIDLIDWTDAPPFRTTGSNRYTVIAEGSHFIFMINDQYVASVTDGRLPKGTLGLALALHDTDQHAIFEVDNIELRIPTPLATPTPKIITTPTITSTAHALLEPPQDVVILEDRFDDNINKWDPFYVTTSVDFHDGKMYMRSNKRNLIGLSLCWGCPLYEDTFYFQAELVLAKDSATGYGLAFCTTGIGNNYYIFQIQPADQTFSLDQSTTKGWRTLVSNEDMNLINAYPNTNTLAVFFDKGRMDLYINGSLATSYEDPNPPYCRRTGVYIDGGLVDLIIDNAFAYDIK
jgi:hypothetical protein